MITVNIHEAKAQLSALIDRAVKGEGFVIAKAGKPLVKVTALNASTSPQRLGFLAGEIAVPEDFNSMGESEITGLLLAQAIGEGITLVTADGQLARYPGPVRKV
jgi:prevent-host-death family protein